MSQMNRGEALRCIQIAKKCMQENNMKKAEKFLNKSLRMYETVEAKQLLESLKNPQPPPTSNNNNNNTNSSPPPERPQRAQTMPNLNRESTASASTSSMNGSSRMSKDEEVNMIRQILRSKDYYSILGVPKDADEKVLKKAFRKKALKCHPDRNKAPGAEEAFKKLSKAYDCLRDPRQRQIYDQYGEDSPQMRRHSHGAQFQQMTPDDIIRMFFGGDFGPGGFGGHHSGFHFQTFPRRRRGNNDTGNGGGGGGVDGGPMVYIMQLLPIILVFFTMILPSLMMFGSNGNSSSGGLWGGRGGNGGMENVYFSLNRHHPFTLEKKTGKDTIYYVQPSRRGTWGYQSRYNYNTARMEQEVESAYLTKLISECQQQTDKEQEKINKIQSNKIDAKRRRKLLQNLMRNKKKYEKLENKQCNKLFEYVEQL